MTETTAVGRWLFTRDVQTLHRRVNGASRITITATASGAAPSPSTVQLGLERNNLDGVGTYEYFMYAKGLTEAQEATFDTLMQTYLNGSY